MEKNKLSRQSSNHRSRSCHNHSCDCDNWNIDNDCCEWDCNCDCHSCKCHDCICCIGPAGPQGPTGPTGPAGEDCCCKNNTLYALQTIFDADPDQNVSVTSFNTTKNGVITPFSPPETFIQNEVVIITSQPQGINNFVSICNIVLMTFSTQPASDETTICQTPACCCNSGMDEALRDLMGPGSFPKNFPEPNPLQIDILDNTNSSLNVIKVFGLCNGILWVEFGNTVEKNRFGAIPLCYIFSARI